VEHEPAKTVVFYLSSRRHVFPDRKKKVLLNSNPELVPENVKV
jgi:hypothetical protein